MLLRSMPGHLIGVVQDFFWRDAASVETKTKETGHIITIVISKMLQSHSTGESEEETAQPIIARPNLHILISAVRRAQSASDDNAIAI